MILQEASEDDLSDPCMKAAISAALESNLKFKIGAALVRRGRLLCVGHNQTKTHPRYGSKSPYHTLHAEGDCLWSADKLGISTIGCTLYVYRRNNLNSKPCPDCLKLIQLCGIRKVIYTT